MNWSVGVKKEIVLPFTYFSFQPMFENIGTLESRLLL